GATALQGGGTHARICVAGVRRHVRARSHRRLRRASAGRFPAARDAGAVVVARSRRRRREGAPSTGARILARRDCGRDPAETNARAWIPDRAARRRGGGAVTAPIQTWLVEPLQRDVAVALERLAASDDVRRIAVMPDVHLAEDVCIGTVVATERMLYPAAVGGDIGCGVAALRLECDADMLRDETAAAWLLARLYEHVPALQHAVARAPELPMAIWDDVLSDPRLERIKRREGRLEFGTLGRGNHFLEFQRDDEGSAWRAARARGRAGDDLGR